MICFFCQQDEPVLIIVETGKVTERRVFPDEFMFHVVLSFFEKGSAWKDNPIFQIGGESFLFICRFNPGIVEKGIRIERKTESQKGESRLLVMPDDPVCFVIHSDI